MQRDAPSQATPPPTLDPPNPPMGQRACGCTTHSNHLDCRRRCAMTHCGYAQRRDASLHSDVEAYLGRAAADATEQARKILREWWAELAEAEADQVIGKAIEYGSQDLVDIGRDLALCMGRADISAEEAAELGIYFYLRGKLSRWTGALVRGERPSDDTLKDLGVYVRMAQRVRAAGGWPGVS